MGPNPEHNLLKKINKCRNDQCNNIGYEHDNIGHEHNNIGYEQNNIGYDKEVICFRGKLI